AARQFPAVICRCHRCPQAIRSILLLNVWLQPAPTNALTFLRRKVKTLLMPSATVGNEPDYSRHCKVTPDAPWCSDPIIAGSSPASTWSPPESDFHPHPWKARSRCEFSLGCQRRHEHHGSRGCRVRHKATFAARREEDCYAVANTADVMAL